MYTFEQAKAKMQKYVDYQNNMFLWNYDSKPNIVIYDNLTMTEKFGWVFFWQSKDIKKDYSNVVVGNGPIIIEKDSLDMYKMMTANEVEENIKIYLEDKNKLAKLEIDEDGNFDVVNIDD